MLSINVQMPSISFQSLSATELVLSTGELGLHLKLVGRLAGLVAVACGWAEGGGRLIESAAQLHDIGKSFLEPELLNKPGPLSEEERQIVQLHPELGWAYLMTVPPSPTIELGAVIALEHHERWDGKGYPFGKAGEAIAPSSRIASICDAYAALRENRCYKPGCSHKQALEKLLAPDRASQGAFDPRVMQAFAACEVQIEAAYLQHDRLLGAR